MHLINTSAILAADNPNDNTQPEIQAESVVSIDILRSSTKLRLA